MPHKKKKKNISISTLLKRILLGLFLIFILLILFIRSPWGQNIIVSKATSFVSNKTHTKVEVEKLYLTFSGNILLKGLYLEDKKGDTLIYSNHLEASVALFPLIKGRAFNLKTLEWRGLKANIFRTNTNSKFNYNFLIDAFTSTDTVTTETNSESLKIDIGLINLKNIDITYKDAVLGIESELKFETFNLETNALNLEKMRFDINQITLNDADINYHQTKPFPANTDTTNSALPFVALRSLKINNSIISYNSIPDHLTTNLSFDNFTLEAPILDLENQIIEINTFQLKNTAIAFQQLNQTNETSIESSSDFKWPEWDITAHTIDLENNEISLKTGQSASLKNNFNAENIQLKALSFKANTITYKPKEANAVISAISFKEQSGFSLDKFNTALQLNDTALGIKKLSIATNNNNITGDIDVNYASLSDFIKSPETAKIKLNLHHFSANPKDAFYFLPELKKNTYIKTLSRKQLTGEIALNGTLNQLSIPKTTIHWGTDTKLIVNGNIENLPNIDALILDLKTINFNTSKTDVVAFVKTDSLGIEFPKKTSLNGRLKGGLNQFKTDLKLAIPEGNIILKGHYKNTNTMAFDALVEVNNLQLNKLLKNEKLGTYTFITKLKGKGANLNDLDAEIATTFKKLTYNSQDFSSLKIDGSLQNGKGNVDLNFDGENLDFNFNTAIVLDSVASKYNAVLNVNGVDFKALNLSKEDIRAKFNLALNIEGNSTSNLKIDGKIKDAIAVKNNKPYTLGAMSINSVLTEETTNFSIESPPVNATLVSNTNPTKLIAALQNQFNSYFEAQPSSEAKIDSSNIDMQFKATIKQAPILKALFLPELTNMAPVNIQIDFNEVSQLLTTKATAPEIIYNGSAINNLDFSLNAEKEKLDFSFGIDSLKTGPVAMQKTTLNGYLKDRVIYSSFKAMDKETILIQMASEITKSKDTTSFHINPSGLIINKQNWDILPNNSIQSTTNFINFTNFRLSQNNQEITVNNSAIENATEAINLQFKNFELGTLTSLLNQETLLASGKLNGDIDIENPFSNTGIIANATITNLQAMEVALGKLTLNAKAIENSKYVLDLKVSGENLNLDITGDYLANSEDNPLDFNIDLKNINLNVVEQFASDYISKTSGNLAGKIKVNGSLDTPKPIGNLNFNDAALTLNAFNAAFSLPKESIKLTDTGIYFEDFTMLDTNKNPFIIDGGILTENISNPAFNFTLKAKNTEILNSTKKDNNLFYGKVNLNTDVSIGGNLNLPKVSGRLVINESSNFTYIIPESEADIVEKQGVVLFVNKEDPNNILTRQNEDSSAPAVLKGFDINAQMSIAEKATFNIVVDEQSGDNLKVSGTGDFNFGIAENGDISLSGKYEVRDGHYEVSLYNLVKRRFDIAKGSSILWSGNPLEAEMNIRAIYELETSASGLMASQLTGESPSVSNQYRQKVPFLVYLNLKGELLTPEISFNLDMPEDEQGELGGDVYTQVQQLNTQQEELNKQVFSLLVLNQFFPTTSSDGSSGGSLSIARDNANAVLSNQLNNFSNKLLGKSGIQLDFGLDSYTDYQGDAPVDKTQLDINASKRLFNNRLIVEVGSGLDIQENSQNAGQTSPLVGTVNIQYLFDDIGRWRLKAYRKNDFESVIDGQVILTGIALIFNQEFNKFEELFAKAIKETVDKTKNENEVEKDKTKQ